METEPILLLLILAAYPKTQIHTQSGQTPFLALTHTCYSVLVFIFPSSLLLERENWSYSLTHNVVRITDFAQANSVPYYSIKHSCFVYRTHLNGKKCEYFGRPTLFFYRLLVLSEVLKHRGSCMHRKARMEPTAVCPCFPLHDEPGECCSQVPSWADSGCHQPHTKGAESHGQDQQGWSL